MRGQETGALREGLLGALSADGDYKAFSVSLTALPFTVSEALPT